MSSVEIIDTKFLDYDIRSCFIDNVEMFLVSDLIRQYNLINKTNKRFKKYLENKQTQELLQKWNKNLDGPNSGLLKNTVKNENNEENTVGPNSGLRSECSKNDKNKGMTVRENSPERFSSNKIDIPHIIKYITFKEIDGVNKGYVVCEELLIACLMWLDPCFAIQVYTFLKNLRSINNNRFTEILNANKDQEKQINLLQDQINQLKSRYTPENFNWHFCVTHNELTNIITTVITKNQYKPVDKNVKRVYDLICCNPLVLEQQLIDILVNDQRFTQISNKEFTTTINNKNIFWFFKNKCKKLRNMLEWKTGITN